MRSISAILGVYLFALAVLPCADEAAWCIFDVEEALAVEVHENNKHDHENECSDHCSPLCTCSCCHMTVRTPGKTGLVITAPAIVFSVLPVQENSFIDQPALHNIWQPPRVS